MRLSKLENVSKRNVTLRHAMGGEFMLTPGNSVSNVSVSNLHEVSGQVRVTHDLTEVTEPVSGRTRLDD